MVACATQKTMIARVWEFPLYWKPSWNGYPKFLSFNFSSQPRQRSGATELPTKKSHLDFIITVSRYALSRRDCEINYPIVNIGSETVAFISNPTKEVNNRMDSDENILSLFCDSDSMAYFSDTTSPRGDLLVGGDNSEFTDPGTRDLMNISAIPFDRVFAELQRFQKENNGSLVIPRSNPIVSQIIPALLIQSSDFSIQDMNGPNVSLTVSTFYTMKCVLSTRATQSKIQCFGPYDLH